MNPRIDFVCYNLQYITSLLRVSDTLNWLKLISYDDDIALCSNQMIWRSCLFIVLVHDEYKFRPMGF